MFMLQRQLLTNFLNTWVSDFSKTHPRYYQRIENNLYSNPQREGNFVGFGDITIWYEPDCGINSRRNRELAIVTADIYHEICVFGRSDLLDLLNNVDEFTTQMAAQYGNWTAELFDEQADLSQIDYSLHMVSREMMEGIQVY
jgi:hypothetical protein